MKKITSFLLKFESSVTNLLMVSVVILVFIAAVMRYAGYPNAWSGELAKAMFVWLVFLGSNRALREGKHIGIDYFTKKFPKKLTNFIDLIMSVIMILFLGFLTIYGIMFCIENSSRLINALPISYSLITLAVPVASIFMIITLLSKITKMISANSFVIEERNKSSNVDMSKESSLTHSVD